MKKTINLTSGNVLAVLTKLSLPILGTSFVQMAYNMIDMIWVGRLGSIAVAAVGTSGFFSWFGSSLALMPRIGVEVGVSQSIGRGDEKERNKFIYSSLLLSCILSVLYGVILLVLRNQVIGFFRLGDENLINMSKSYLTVMVLGMIFTFLNPLFTGIFNASGSSKNPFLINVTGLIVNIVLDPILIFGGFGLNGMGVIGAALATLIGQAVVTIIFVVVFIRNGYSLSFKNKMHINKETIYKIYKLGAPIALQNCLFSFFAMLVGRIISSWGSTAIAVQKVGAQIEALSWMTSEGLATALTTFIGQNYGANKFDRVNKGYKCAFIIALSIGLLSTVLFVFFGETVFSAFIKEDMVIKEGGMYLKILGYSQIFMCIEITVQGAFSGLGNTIIPAIISILFTGLRAPIALFLGHNTSLGVNGAWWSISGTSILKGIIAISLFIIFIRRKNSQMKMIEN